MGQIKWEFDKQVNKQIMGAFVKQKQGNISQGWRKELTALPDQEMSPQRGNDRNPFSANSQRIHRGREMSGRRDKYAREMSSVLGGRNANPVGEIQAKDMDRGGKVRDGSTASEMQRVWENARAATGFFASVPTIHAGPNAKGNLDVSAGGNGVWANNGRNIE